MSEKKISFQFSEAMKGFVQLGQATEYEKAYRQGSKSNTTCAFSLTIEIPDIDKFARDPNGEANATGFVDCPALGGRYKIEKGTINLLIDVVHRRHTIKDMRYRLQFRAAKGRALTLSGVKFVDDDGIIHMWRDTTKLFTKLFEGNVERGDEDKAKVVACGILRLGLWDVTKLVLSFRSNPPTVPSWLHASTRFMLFFMKGLWQVYGLKFSRA